MVESGFVLFNCVYRASEHGTNYFSCVVAKSILGKNLPDVVYDDKGYCIKNNRDFLSMNDIGDGIMSEAQKNTSLTNTELEGQKSISKIREKIEQYFGFAYKYHGAGKEVRFTSLVKFNLDHIYVE